MTSIIEKLKQETQEGNGHLAARKISNGEWLTVAFDWRDGSYTWYHDWWDDDIPHEFGQGGSKRSTITEEQASVFLFDVKD